MDIKNKIENYINEKTTDGFHDSSLLLVKIDPTVKEIMVKIKHMRTIDEIESYVITEIDFYNISEMQLVNMEKEKNQFGVDDDITDITVTERNNSIQVQILGSRGWIFSFITKDCKINEHMADDQR